MSWFRTPSRLAEIPRLRPRAAQPISARVKFDELVPEPMAYLGQAAYLQLDQFERLSGIVATAPDLESKEQLSHAAGVALAKHHGLVAEIRRQGGDAAEVMRPFAPAVDRYQEVTGGADWYEALLSSYLTSGLLDDFFSRLAAGLPGELARAVSALLDPDSGRHIIVDILAAAIERDAGLGSRLALWGRRLVGDTLLVARSALEASGGLSHDDERVEPVFTDLIAEHTRRMDRLGLTA